MSSNLQNHISRRKSNINVTLYNCQTICNPFLANVPILYPLKTPENQKFSGVFRGYKMETLARNGLKWVESKKLLTSSVIC